MIRAVIISGDREGAPVRWGGTQVHDIIMQPDTPYGRGRLKRLVRESIHGMEDDVVSIKYEDTEQPDQPGRDVTTDFVELTEPEAVGFKACPKCPWDWLCESKGECEGVDKDYNPSSIDDDEEDDAVEEGDAT